ncbi:MAG TPA: YraN family protein [Anaerolineaceae bacterium]|nr:YraN family protein [Anaerolineaceae bacterium]
MNADSLHNMSLGRQGEDLAANYLVEKGYKILQRNYRAGHQEVDIIASQDGLLHFVEVKTRRTTQFGLGEDAMHNKKIYRLLQAIDAYLGNSEGDTEYQLDLIVVELRKISEPNFIHYQAIGPIDVD